MVRKMKIKYITEGKRPKPKVRNQISAVSVLRVVRMAATFANLE